MIEELLKGKAPAHSSNSSSTDLEGESAPRLGSPQPIDEAKTPQPDTTPKAPPRRLEGLEVASTSDHTAAQDSKAPFSLPAFPPLPPPNGAPGPAEVRHTPQPSGQTPSGSRHSQPPSAPDGSHSGGSTKKRNREELDIAGRGPSFALGAPVPSPKRVKLDIDLEELEEDPASFQKTVLSRFTTPPNLPPANAPSTPALVSRPDYPFNRGSPSPQQRQQRRTPATGELRHRVPSPARRPETTIRRTPEPTSSSAGPSHMVASGTLASAVGGIFNPPSSSTPARPVPSSLLVRTSAATSRLARGARPYERPPATAPSPPPPAISTVGPATEGHDSGESQSSNSTDSGGAGGANQAPAPEHVEMVTEPPTPNRATSRPGHGMPPIPGAQPLDPLDPLRFTGTIQRRGGRVNPPNSTTPNSRVRQVAPETPMASPTRYGTEINPSMRHLY